jgi:hypothetical protein
MLALNNNTSILLDSTGYYLKLPYKDTQTKGTGVINSLPFYPTFDMDSMFSFISYYKSQNCISWYVPPYLNTYDNITINVWYDVNPVPVTSSKIYLNSSNITTLTNTNNDRCYILNDFTNIQLSNGSSIGTNFYYFNISYDTTNSYNVYYE